MGGHDTSAWSDTEASTLPRSQGQEFDEQTAVVIEQLARQVSQKSSHLGGNHAFKPEAGSSLDPRSPKFDAKAWIKAFVRIQETGSHGPSRALGVAYKDLSVFGWSAGAAVQPTVPNRITNLFTRARSLVSRSQDEHRVEILRNFEGAVGEGELLLVLGPPGSGCSTLLKTLAGQTAGLKVSPEASMNFTGKFRGDVLYNAEIDSHLPHLTVGETLLFASRARSGQVKIDGVSAIEIDTMLRDVVMAVFGISHTVNTRVGNDFVRGVSGGERKRVSIAEATLTGAKFQCWDNSTRGLDSANAINFCQTLRSQADLMSVSAAVAIYQAPQSAYDLFNLVTVLYEGRQIYFGKTTDAQAYFEELGFECPERQTTPDFLTSMTNPSERRAKPGFENRVPRTPDEFAVKWTESKERQALHAEIANYETRYPREQRLIDYEKSRRAEQAKSQRPKSPYTITYLSQVRLTMWRAWRRLLADPTFTIAQLLFNLVLAIILGTMFFDLDDDSSSFYYRGGLVFFSLILNAFASQLEVLTVYEERPVVEKQNRYAFYHQSAQAVASYLIDLPYKTVNMIIFNVIIYFMANLRREAGSFFFFCLATYLTTLIMSGIFRTLASVTRTSHQAMIPSAIASLGLMMYTGFAIPTNIMPGWSRWMAYINPLAYSFEALMANEFHGREFPCASIVPTGPGYDNAPSESRVCPVVGAVAGSSVVDGDAYINLTYSYYNANKWRNIGILFAFLVGTFITYLVSAEFAKPPKSKGEVLVFLKSKAIKGLWRRGVVDTTDPEAQVPGRIPSPETGDEDETDDSLATESDVFHWQNLCYDIKIKKEDRRILDSVDGWVKPGASTALMGASGAGKTTLLDVLATRVTMGEVTGDAFINGRPTDTSFQHRVGYVQQQDLHLETMTAREALEFSATLRQSSEISREEKLDYVNQVIDMLEMQPFADAIIGVPGEGLNVEQRKRLTIGVELAARPELLLFLDEPTSGLDSQTSWSISQLIKKLTKSGQAILCTIHQPSAILFNQFDRLLFLAPGGKTVYFGEIGPDAKILIDYFERNGAGKCPVDANPAEWMLGVIKPPTDGSGSIDWHQVWRNSPEYLAVKEELARLRALADNDSVATYATDSHASQNEEFVTSFATQFWQVFKRTYKHFWRSPTYIWSKTIMIFIASLYVGYSFKASNSLQGLQNQLYAIFMLFIIFGNINEQIMPMFIPQRELYEVRERPSKVYRWTTFLLSNIIVEAGWNTLMSVIMFLSWYYPIGFAKHLGDDERASRGFLTFLLWWMYLLFISTISHAVVVWIETPDTAGVLASLLWMLCISACGVGIAYGDLPKFWTFMYRVSPGTYLVSGLMSSTIANGEITCSEKEILHVRPPSNMSCSDYLGPFIESINGNLLTPDATDSCAFCPMKSTNQFLARFNIDWENRHWHFGLLWVYISANIALALGLYWVFRVPKTKSPKA
ncbi:ABC multidrug transporter atrG [Paramyrothecium foliicola]|nr:ABC multidrug transporter atrG [Paramyrothecium foliicola]